MSILADNLAALATRDPDLATLLVTTAPLAGTIETTRAGHPTLGVDGVLLHNRVDPAREARAWAGEARARLERNEAAVAGVLGFGLGYHVEALAAAWSGRIVVFEPDRGLLRTAFAARDLRPLLDRVEFAAEPIPDEALAGWPGMVVLAHMPSILRPDGRLRALRERIMARTVLSTLRLRILVISPLVGGSYPLTAYCARALAELGHEVTVLDLAAFGPGFEAIPSFTPRQEARNRIAEEWGRFMGAGVVAAVEAAQPDLVVAMAQAPLDPRVLREIGRRGVLRALWFVEDHRLFDYWRAVIPDYDYFFGIQTGAFLDEARRLTSGHVGYLPCAADPVVHRPLVLTPEEQAEFGAPVAFVGAGYRNRRIAFRQLLDFGLRIWGSEWKDAGQLADCVQRRGARVPTEDTVRVFNASAVNLNLHSSTWVDGVDPRGDFVNPRTFELAACGAFQLVDERTLLPPLLAPGTEVATFSGAAGLPDLVRHYLDRPDEREALAAAGRARVLAEHTYRHRMARLLEAVCARDGERLQSRPRGTTVGEVARAEGATALGGLLRRLPSQAPCTLDGIVRGLAHRNGDLSDPEGICLFLHQFDEMYVRERRA
jgi:spore maturation protein CgeB